MLKCTRCCETKEPTEFAARRRSANGRQYVCRACAAAYNAARRKPACKSPGAEPSEKLYILSYPWAGSPLKVGRTHDVSARVGQLEGGHNFRLTLLAVFPGLGAQEHKVHTLLKSFRATNGRGKEWFQVTLAHALTTIAMCVQDSPDTDLAQKKSPNATK